jgi:hypothetical protein
MQRADGSRRRWLLNLGLALFIIALALLVKYQPGVREPQESPPLTDLAADQIARIRIARLGQPEIVLAKMGQDWRLVAPLQARADRFRIDGLLHLAGARTEGSFPLPSGDLAKYGLDKPAAKIWLDNAEITFGGAHSLNDLQYVLYNGQIYLIQNAGLRSIPSELTGFFSSRLLDESYKLVGLKLPKFSLTLKDGSWQAEPENKALSNDRMNSFVDEWRYARALNVKQSSGKPVLGNVRVSFLEGQPATTAGAQTPKNLDLGILAYKPELVLYRKDEALEYHFPQEAGERLLNLTPE